MTIGSLWTLKEKKSSFGNWQTMLALERVKVLTGALLCIAIDPWSSFNRETVAACRKSVLNLWVCFMMSITPVYFKVEYTHKWYKDN